MAVSVVKKSTIYFFYQHFVPTGTSALCQVLQCSD